MPIHPPVSSWPFINLHIRWMERMVDIHQSLTQLIKRPIRLRYGHMQSFRDMYTTTNDLLALHSLEVSNAQFPILWLEQEAMPTHPDNYTNCNGMLLITLYPALPQRPILGSSS